MSFKEKSVGTPVYTEQLGNLVRVGSWFKSCAQDDHIYRNPDNAAKQSILNDYYQFSLFFVSYGFVRYLSSFTSYKDCALIGKSIVKFFVAFTVTSPLDAHLVYACFSLFLDKVRVLQGVHAANPRTVFVVVSISTADAVYARHAFWFLTVF